MVKFREAADKNFCLFLLKINHISKHNKENKMLREIFPMVANLEYSRSLLLDSIENQCWGEKFYCVITLLWIFPKFTFLNIQVLVSPLMRQLLNVWILHRNFWGLNPVSKGGPHLWNEGRVTIKTLPLSFWDK